jgi:hypothetical protein
MGKETIMGQVNIIMKVAMKKALMKDMLSSTLSSRDYK